MDLNALYTLASYNVSTAWDRIKLAEATRQAINNYRSRCVPNTPEEAGKAFLDALIEELTTDLNAAQHRLQQAACYMATLHAQLKVRLAILPTPSPMVTLARTLGEDLSKACQEYNTHNHFRLSLRDAA